MQGRESLQPCGSASVSVSNRCATMLQRDRILVARRGSGGTLRSRTGLQSLVTDFGFALAIAAAPILAHAEVHLASPFTDHMVLQRDRPVAIWGTADAGESVTIEFAGQKKSATASADGKWRIILDPLTASADARELLVTAGIPNSEIQNQKFQDVLVGEVWLASGQSNMVFTLSKSVNPWAGVVNEEQEIAAAQFPEIRMFTGAAKKSYEPQMQVGGTWQVCTPENAPRFSAIGYFFARNLQESLHVPIGIVTLAFGASTAEAWIRRETLAIDPKLKPMLDEFDAKVKTYTPPSEEALKSWQEARDKARAAGERPPRRPGQDPVQDQHNATVLFNGMIQPVIPYAIRGVIWYQGESITGGEAGRALYPHVQATLVQDWRRLWENETLPFYICQLAGQEANSNSPEVREAQATILGLRYTGMAVTTDLGEVHDVHPHRKREVGDRLARIALANVYGRAIEFSGPRYQSMTVEGDVVHVKFTHIGGSLVAKDGGPLKWFEIAGADGKFVAAEARIAGDTVVVSSAAVPAPVAARYAWVNFPDGCNLFNAAGLPAAQFRTDAESKP
jgi:sialate O-acetylesterase